MLDNGREDSEMVKVEWNGQMAHPMKESGVMAMLMEWAY